MSYNSYKTKSSCPCKGCTYRYARCHSECARYIGWSKKQQAEKEQAYKKHTTEKAADDYRIEGLNKGKKKWRKQ